MSFNNTRTHTKPKRRGKYQVEEINGKITMTKELEAKFRQLYPVTMNPDLMKMFGLSHSTLHRFAREYGLKKDMKVIHKKHAKQIKKICEENGYYDSIKGRAPSPQCIEATKRMRAEGFHPIKHLRETDKRKYNALIKKKREDRLTLEAAERKRVKWGLPQRTRLNRPAFIYTKRELYRRYFAKKYGYILGDFREGSGERYTFFYDEKTERHESFELNSMKDRFRFVSIEHTDIFIPNYETKTKTKTKTRNEYEDSRL